MDRIIAPPFGKRFLFALGLVAVLAVQFWTQSRYPSLNEKAMMSGAIQLEDPLSFEAHYPLQDDFPLWKKVAYSTGNWIDTNRRGMTFGVLFGAAFLTLLGYVRRRSFAGPYANALLGLGMGAPLGVCVNCAAPIAKALYSGGARAETTLSAMVASPTLNVVVLTMLFSLMPFYMAVTKIALSLVVILAAVPLLCRFLPRSQLQIEVPVLLRSALPSPTAAPAAETLIQAVYRFAWDFFRNLWFIVSRTVPLMFVAGFLGAVVATLLPPGLLAGRSFGLASVVAVAVVGTFLPVPIGFDVVASGALLGSGLDTGYVMALLFTLGIFSVYSFFVVAGAISLRAASLMAGVVIALGIAAGIGVHAYHAYMQKRALDLLTTFDLGLISPAHAGTSPSGMFPAVIVDDGARITVSKIAHVPRSAPAAAPFTRLEGWTLGIDAPVEFGFRDMWPPFWEGRGISAGDFDRDGDADLVLASTEVGLRFYRNDGTGRFAAAAFPLGAIASMPVFNAALVDIDGDGWLDLFVSTFHQGNHWIRNEAGTFDGSRAQVVANRPDAVLTMAASFGDADRDGDLDLALGNWAAGWYRRVPGEEARNRVVFNDGGALDGSHFEELPGLPGETLSMLFSDIDLDGDLDLLEGNDFEQPDEFYRGDGRGGFKPITRKDGVIPMTTTTTMAIKTADLHNDGTPEIYIAQIAGRSSGVSKKLKLRPLDGYCDGIGRDSDREICQSNMAIKRWYRSGHSFDPAYASKCAELSGRDGEDCKGMLVKDLAIQSKDSGICGLIPVANRRARQLCDIHFKPFPSPTAEELAETIPQVLRRNVLLSPKGDGSYEERAVEEGLEIGGWSWDVKIADFDNDGLKDVYVVNGTWIPNEITPSNLFFRNGGDGTFSEQSGPFGLEDYMITAAALAVDIDGDGDLDVVTAQVNAPVAVFVNNDQAGSAITFAFEDAIGNRFGIGNRVEIDYGGGRRQMAELQSGGGFMSFDAPILHFGLGEARTVDKVTVSWSTGERTVIDGPFEAGAQYVVARDPVGTR